VQRKYGSPRGPPSSRSWYPPRQWAQGGPYDSDTSKDQTFSLVIFRLLLSSSSRLRKSARSILNTKPSNSSARRLTTQNVDLTYGQCIKLRISLLGLAPLLGELVLFSTAVALRTSLSSCSSCATRSRVTTAFFNRSTRLFAQSAGAW
jgi:hypothetical protein